MTYKTSRDRKVDQAFFHATTQRGASFLFSSSSHHHHPHHLHHIFTTSKHLSQWESMKQNIKLISLTIFTSCGQQRLLLTYPGREVTSSVLGQSVTMIHGGRFQLASLHLVVDIVYHLDYYCWTFPW